MLSRRELSGFWGQVNRRPCWSYDIPKRKWVVLQILTTAIVGMAVTIPVSLLLNWWDLASAIVGPFGAGLFFSLFNHRKWDGDRHECPQEQARAFE